MSVIEKIDKFGIEHANRYYGHLFSCNNCGTQEYEYVKKGIVALGALEICPVCECLTYKG
jgi:hypothetical protein